MDIQTFAEKANFPTKWKEVDLQNYVIKVLRAKGYKCNAEVNMNFGRADIVTNWKGGTIIECKKYLRREDIYQASGQCHLYGLKNNYQFVLIGMSPPIESEIQPAFNTARMVQQDKRIQVVFLNLSEEWLPSKITKQEASLTFWNFISAFKLDNPVKAVPNFKINVKLTLKILRSPITWGVLLVLAYWMQYNFKKIDLTCKNCSFNPKEIIRYLK